MLRDTSAINPPPVSQVEVKKTDVQVTDLQIIAGQKASQPLIQLVDSSSASESSKAPIKLEQIVA